MAKTAQVYGPYTEEKDLCIYDEVGHKNYPKNIYNWISEYDVKLTNYLKRVEAFLDNSKNTKVFNDMDGLTDASGKTALNYQQELRTRLAEMKKSQVNLKKHIKLKAYYLRRTEIKEVLDKCNYKKYPFTKEETEICIKKRKEMFIWLEKTEAVISELGGDLA